MARGREGWGSWQLLSLVIATSSTKWAGLFQSEPILSHRRASPARLWATIHPSPLPPEARPGPGQSRPSKNWTVPSRPRGPALDILIPFNKNVFYLVMTRIRQDRYISIEIYQTLVNLYLVSKKMNLYLFNVKLF